MAEPPDCHIANKGTLNVLLWAKFIKFSMYHKVLPPLPGFGTNTSGNSLWAAQP